MHPATQAPVGLNPFPQVLGTESQDKVSGVYNAHQFLLGPISCPQYQPLPLGPHSCLPDPQPLAPVTQQSSLTFDAQVAQGLSSSDWHGSGRLWEIQAGICLRSITVALQPAGRDQQLIL